MTNAVRLQDGVVVEVVPVPAGVDLAEMFHPGLAFVSTDAEVEPGWIADGDGYAPAPPTGLAPPPIPAAITPLQARNGLRAWGIGKAEIAGFFATIDDELTREAAEDAWEYATIIERSNPLIAACAAHLGKSAEEVDQFFRAAAGL